MGSLKNKAFCSCTLFLLAAQSAHGQTIVQHSHESVCSNIVALTGDVKLNCSNLTPAQKKAIEQIPAVLKMALTNQEYLAAIEAKLDEVSKPGPAVVVQSGGVASVGQMGGVTAGTVNYAGAKVPNFLGTEMVDKNGRGNALRAKDDKGHPITYARFYADTEWTDPKILVGCDRPCMPAVAEPWTWSILFSGLFDGFIASAHPEMAIFEFTGQLHPMAANTYYLVGVASLDDDPVKILTVSPFLGALPPH